MKLAIMQPYFLPYIGYWQLMNSVDCFVIYDDIEFSKKGWVHRNRFLRDGDSQMFTLPLKKDSDFLDIRNRNLIDNYLEFNLKTLRKIEAAYSKAPYFKDIFPFIESCMLQKDRFNLFDFIYHSVIVMKEFLKIDTEIIISSTLGIERKKGVERVLSICRELNAKHYINSIGGISLYNKSEFRNFNVQLSFLKSNEIDYTQFKGEFVPNLSIIDVLMFNNRERVFQYLDKYTLI